MQHSNQFVNPFLGGSDVTRVSHDNAKTITSLEISELSGKPHNDVMKAIRKMEPTWRKVTQGNFSLSEYQDDSGKKNPMYSLTKEESIFVATKFNDEARARIILRWSELEKKTQESKKPMDPFEYMQYSLNMMIEQSQRVKELEEKVIMVEAKTKIAPNYFSIMGYCAYHGIQVNINEAKMWGKRCTGICKSEGYSIDQITDPRFGRVNAYPVEALNKCFEFVKHKHKSALSGKRVRIKFDVPRIGGQYITITDWADRIEPLDFDEELLLGKVVRDIEYVRVKDLDL